MAYRVHRNLPEVHSKNGLLKTELNMRQDTFTIGKHKLTLANFDGTVPGKICRLKPGDRLQWRLFNNMTEDLGLPLDNGPVTDLQKSLNFTNVLLAQQEHTDTALAYAATNRLWKLAFQQLLVKEELSSFFTATNG